MEQRDLIEEAACRVADAWQDWKHRNPNQPPVLDATEMALDELERCTRESEFRKVKP